MFLSLLVCYRKGITLIFVNPDTEIDFQFLGVKRGNANELGDTYASPGKSSLFFLRDVSDSMESVHPEIWTLSPQNVTDLVTSGALA